MLLSVAAFGISACVSTATVTAAAVAAVMINISCNNNIHTALQPYSMSDTVASSMCDTKHQADASLFDGEGEYAVLR